MPPQDPQKPPQSLASELDKAAQNLGVKGVAASATEAAAEKLEQSGLGVTKEGAKSTLPWIVAGGAAVASVAMFNPIDNLMRKTFSGLRQIVTGFGYLEKIPVLGMVFTAVGDAVETIGKGAAYAVPAVLGFLGLKAFQTPEAKPEADKPGIGMPAAMLGAMPAMAIAGRNAPALRAAAKTDEVIGKKGATVTIEDELGRAFTPEDRKTIDKIRIDADVADEQKKIKDLAENKKIKLENAPGKAAKVAGGLFAGLINAVSFLWNNTFGRVFGLVGVPKIPYVAADTLTPKNQTYKHAVLREKEINALPKSSIDAKVRAAFGLRPNGPATASTGANAPTMDSHASPSAVINENNIGRPEYRAGKLVWKDADYAPLVEAQNDFNRAKAASDVAGQNRAQARIALAEEQLAPARLAKLQAIGVDGVGQYAAANADNFANFHQEAIERLQQQSNRLAARNSNSSPSTTAIAERPSAAGTREEMARVAAAATNGEPGFLSNQIRPGLVKAGGLAAAAQAIFVFNNKDATTTEKVTAGTMAGAGVGATAAELRAIKLLVDSANGVSKASAAEIAAAQRLASTLGKVMVVPGTFFSAYSSYENFSKGDYYHGSKDAITAAALPGLYLVPVAGQLAIIGTTTAGIIEDSIHIGKTLNKISDMKDQIDRNYTEDFKHFRHAEIAVQVHLRDKMVIEHGVPLIPTPEGGALLDVSNNKHVQIMREELIKLRDKFKKDMDANNYSLLPRFYKPFGLFAETQDKFEDARDDYKRFDAAVKEFDGYIRHQRSHSADAKPASHDVDHTAPLRPSDTPTIDPNLVQGKQQPNKGGSPTKAG